MPSARATLPCQERPPRGATPGARGLWLVAITLLAGCVGNQAPPPGEDPPEESTPGAFTYVCAGGEASPQPCVGSLRDGDAARVEPFVALHPDDARVAAIGVNAGRGAALEVEGAGPGYHPRRLEVHVTEDGGHTWRRAPIPVFRPGSSLPLEQGLSQDPALAFDASGTLHLTGLTSTSAYDPAEDLFHVSSPDLGRTWSAPTWFSTGGTAGRQWIHAAPGGALFVPWEVKADDGKHTTVSWSADNGSTWRHQSPDHWVRDCGYPTLAVNHPDALVACAGRDRAGVHLFRFNATRGSLDPVASPLGVDAVIAFLAGEAGRLSLMVQEGHREIHVVHSADGGITWDEPVALTTAVEELRGWDRLELMYAQADPWGSTHLLLRTSRACPNPACEAGQELPPSRVLHAAFPTAAGADRVSVAPLATDPAPVGERHARPPDVAYLDDGFFGAAFSGDAGILVWTRDRTVEFTYLRPSRDDARPGA